MTTYANFDLRLDGAKGAFTAEVLESPAGQTSGPQSLPVTLPAMPELQAASLHRLEAVGQALWAYAFGTAQVAGLWRASLAAAAARGAGLRLRLMLEGVELAALPWELLQDDLTGRFLALDPATPIVRFLRLPYAAAAWPAGRPLSLLFTGAEPDDLPGLAVGEESCTVAAALVEPVRAGRLIQAAIPSGATVEDLSAALRKGVDIWHFAGHGDEAGLVFEDGQGGIAFAYAQTLGLLLTGEGVRLAVLNACRAGLSGGQAASVAGALVRAGLPAVIAMQGELVDSAAGALARGLYVALAEGLPVDRALTAGRKAIAALGGPFANSWWLPALFMRAPDGVLWRQESDALSEAEEAPETGGSQGDRIRATGPVATRGGVVNTGSGVAFVGNSNTVITGKVLGDVSVQSGAFPAATGDRAGFLRLLAEIRQEVAALSPTALAAEDLEDALDALDKATEQAGRSQPPGARIDRGLAGVEELLAARQSGLAGRIAQARRLARMLFR